MSELDLCIGELRDAAKLLTAVADSLTALFSGGYEEPEQKVPPPATQSKPKEDPKPVTLEQVRAVLAEKSRSGHTAEVRELLLKYGAAKLSEIDPAEYPTLLAEAAEIGLTEGGANG
jgi:hypothetical protein